jgi:hypothetical protein
VRQGLQIGGTGARILTRSIGSWSFRQYPADPVTMDNLTAQREIHLGAVTPRASWLVQFSIALAILLWGMIELASFAIDGRPAGARTLVLLLLGAWLLFESFRARNVAWIVADNEIRIHRWHPLGRKHGELVVKGDEISQMRVVNNDGDAASFSLEFVLTSGKLLRSPPVPDATRLYESSTQIAEKLGLDDVAPADISDPRDTANPEVYLGRRPSRLKSRTDRTILLLIAGLFSLPFALTGTPSRRPSSTRSLCCLVLPRPS